MGSLGNLGTYLTLLLIHCFILAQAHREHKVHNIVLYPDKESWCKTTPIKQVVTWPMCAPQELDNNVCVGACFSYMVPHSEPSAPGDLIRPYCDSCQPLDSIWHTVTLDCKDKDDNPTTMQKKVQIITNCSCSSCMESSRIKPDLNSLLQSLELESARVNAAANHHHHHQAHHPHHPHQAPPAAEQQQQQAPESSSDSATAPESSLPPAPGAVESPDETAAAQHQNESAAAAAVTLPTTRASTVTIETNIGGSQVAQPPAPPAAAASSAHETPDLLLDPNLNGTVKNLSLSSFGLSGSSPGGVAGAAGKINERFLQLLKSLNDPALGDDKLDKLGKLENLEKLASEYPATQELLAKLSELLRKVRTQEEVQANLDPLNDDDIGDGSLTDDLLQLSPIGGGSSTSPPQPLLPEMPKSDDDEEVPSLQDQQMRVAASMMHRTGPHHSMVLDSGVKEKIDVESHYLHPALAGQEISYHDNVLSDKAKKKDF